MRRVNCMPSSRIRVNGCVAVVAAAATMFSYCLTSQALASSPVQANCVNTLDLAALSHTTSVVQNSSQLLALTCAEETVDPPIAVTAVALRSLNP